MEIAIVPSGENFIVDTQKVREQTYQPHHNVLAQARFQFLSKAEKAEKLQTNIALQ